MANGKSLVSDFQSLVSKDLLAVLFLILFPFVYFWQVTLGQGVWLTTDILRLFYPFSVELARALNEGRLPLWTPNLLVGFPLLAEGHVGALYPINLLLYKFFPVHHALSYNILLHVAWAGCGMYTFTRARGIGIAGALFAGFVFAFNGVVFGQMFHPPILFAVAWLPWLIFLVAQCQTTHGSARAVWFALAALALGGQFLIGSVQMAFVNALAVAVFGVFGGFVVNSGQSIVNKPLLTVHRSLFTTVFLLALGGGIAAIQLIPTGELVGYSVRGGILGREFVTSYSLPPEYLAQFVAPFAQGEPAEGNEEYRAYFGIAPLLFAFGALLRRRNRQTIFFAAFGLVALSLAFGAINPLYQLLHQLPPFNFFRVPARYLYLVVFAAAFLGAVAFEAVRNHTDHNAKLTGACPEEQRSGGFCAVVAAISFFLVSLPIALTYTQPLGFWLDAWRVLPILIALIALCALALAWTRKIARGSFTILMLGLTIFDLASYAPPFLKTIDALTPAAGVPAPPRSVQLLGDALTRGRIYTDDSIFPSPPAIRNALFPNTALLYDRVSAQIYSSLAFGRHQAYVYNVSPAMLNLLNVRYVMIPLEPRPLTKSALPAAALGYAILREDITLAPTGVHAIQIVSATEQAADLPNGALIAQVVLDFEDGATQTLRLRAGVETTDWDYDRKRADNAVQHARAPIAHSFPAYWRAFGRAFEGHTYRARFELTPPRKIVGARARVIESGAQVIIADVTLETDDRAISLARVSGRSDFVLAYLSDTVAAWENRDALPRAFIAQQSVRLNDDAAFTRLRDPEFAPARQVLLAASPDRLMQADSAQALPQIQSPGEAAITESRSDRVTITAATDQRGYLVLTDSWYPGWRAWVDGQPTPIERADVLFRAVPLEPGTHTVVFEYRPDSWLVGAVVSVLSLVILIVYVGMNIGRAI